MGGYGFRKSSGSLAIFAAIRRVITEQHRPDICVAIPLPSRKARVYNCLVGPGVPVFLDARFGDEVLFLQVAALRFDSPDDDPAWHNTSFGALRQSRRFCKTFPAALLWVEIHQPKLSNGGYRISTTILAP
jgi:hypothetical protein